MSGDSASPFRVRGVIEGFYGPPWTHEQRLDMAAFLGRHGMNTFAYAPKDDPLLRAEWRSPYSGEDLKRLRELLDACRASQVDLLFCVSPGLSMRYSSAEDRAALVAKYHSVGELGVRYFGLLLDDIPATLQWPEDRAAFAGLLDAQVAVVAEVYAHLPAGSRLIVCPTQYWGYGDEPEVARLGTNLDPRIEMFWTGRQIVSPALDLFDAATFARANHRLPTYWDNYPVNDLHMSRELHIGPYLGRDRHLYRFAHGVIANGMELYEASKIGFATIADYLTDPETYDPEASWQAAIREVAGDADAEAFLLFADNVRTSALSAAESVILGAAIERFIFTSRHGAGEPAAAPALAELAQRMLQAADHLLRGDVRNRRLMDECRPWIEAFELGARAVERIATLAAEERLREHGPQELMPFLEQLRRAPVAVFGDLLDMTLTDLTAVHSGGQTQ